MLDSKQRAWLRAQANTISAGFQIGKEEINARVCQGLAEMLTTHELVKVTFMKSTATELSELARDLCARVGAEPVQMIGRRLVLYRHSEKLARQGRALQLP
jgi:RNA-binding protein